MLRVQHANVMLTDSASRFLPTGVPALHSCGQAPVLPPNWGFTVTSQLVMLTSKSQAGLGNSLTPEQHYSKPAAVL